MASERLMIAAPVVEVGVGQRFESLPPHITLVPWFDLASSQWPRFDQQLREEDVAWDLDARVHVVAKDRFGTADKPVAVNRLFGITLVLAHAHTARIAREYGAQYDETYTGENWHGHITDKPGYDIDIGENLELHSIAVFEKQPTNKIVKALYTRAETLFAGE